MESELVKTINRYFHDEEALSFGTRHLLRISLESKFYAGFFEKFFADNKSSARILDIGAGTGLVGASAPEGAGKFVCTDISCEMLKVLKNGLGPKRPDALDCVVCDAESLPFGDGVFDAVTCNAAMHHFASIDRFAREAGRVLAGDGVLVIGFETNRRFWNTRAVCLLYRLAAKIARRAAGGGMPYGKICERVNQRLIKDNFISAPLKDAEILQYVDIHSPNAGDRIDYSKGFDAFELLKGALNGYEHSIFYHYDSLPGFVRLVNRLFFPASAPQFSLVLKKRPR